MLTPVTVGLSAFIQHRLTGDKIKYTTFVFQDQLVNCGMSPVCDNVTL
jgi:hypothetical protein